MAPPKIFTEELIDKIIHLYFEKQLSIATIALRLELVASSVASIIKLHAKNRFQEFFTTEELNDFITYDFKFLTLKYPQYRGNFLKLILSYIEKKPKENKLYKRCPNCNQLIVVQNKLELEKITHVCTKQQKKLSKEFTGLGWKSSFTKETTKEDNFGVYSNKAKS